MCAETHVTYEQPERSQQNSNRGLPAYRNRTVRNGWSKTNWGLCLIVHFRLENLQGNQFLVDCFQSPKSCAAGSQCKCMGQLPQTNSQECCSCWRATPHGKPRFDISIYRYIYLRIFFFLLFTLSAGSTDYQGRSYNQLIYLAYLCLLPSVVPPLQGQLSLYLSNSYCPRTCLLCSFTLIRMGFTPQWSKENLACHCHFAE